MLLQVGPVRAIAARSRLKPIRPFQRESTAIVDKMVDYFFGDGPSQRYSLLSFVEIVHFLVLWKTSPLLFFFSKFDQKIVARSLYQICSDMHKLSWP